MIVPSWEQELDPVLPRIRDRAGEYDRSGAWPAEDLADLASIGAMRWAVPPTAGGEPDPWPPPAGAPPTTTPSRALRLHLRYHAIASASLATALVLSQRDSAVGLIDGAGDSPLRNELLPQLASNELFTTVGIAQLTTSRQGGPPALAAERVSGGYVLNGFIPWCTGAAKADVIIAGAALPGGQQILFALPPALPGVRVEAPLPLVALASTWTAAVKCNGVRLEDRWVVRGPAPNVLGCRRLSLPLGQAFLGLGLCLGTLTLIREHRSDTARAAAERLGVQYEALFREVEALSHPGRDAEATAESARVRGACNDLAVRTTHAAVALYKGSGLMLHHPAQRLAREAMFLLVWSCPNPVIDCTVDLLADG